MSQAPQNFENHAKLVPGYHYVITGMLLFLLGSSAYRLVTAFSVDALANLVMVLALLVTAFYARVFPMGVQDRVIRLEQSLRMERLLPDDLKPRIPQITTSQFVGLRFASDAELEALTRKVLDEGIEDRKAIKQMVNDWQPDNHRI